MADCPHTIGVEFGTRIIEVWEIYKIKITRRNTEAKGFYFITTKYKDKGRLKKKKGNWAFGRN